MDPNIVVGDATLPISAPVPAAGVTPPGLATDAKGRRISVKPLDPLEEYRLYKIMGAASESKRAVDVAMWAAAVRSIDGNDLQFPNTERELQARIALLGSEGYAAVAAALVSLEEPLPAGAEAVKN